MTNYPEVQSVFDHDTDSELQMCVAINATTTNMDLIANMNPDLTIAQVIALLDAERIEYSVYERPRQRPRN